MLLNYLRTMLRSISKNALFSSLNILGLSLGLSGSLLIMMWVFDERSVNGFHDDDIYQVFDNQTFSDGPIVTSPSLPAPMSPEIREKIAELDGATRFWSWGSALVQSSEKNFLQSLRYVDPEFLKMFNFPLLKGNIDKALNDPAGIVITETMSKRYFADEDPIGKTLSITTSWYKAKEFHVTGLIQDPPANSSLKFDALLWIEPPFEINKGWMGNWGNYNTSIYVKLRPDANPENVSQKITDIFRSHEKESDDVFILQKFSDTYLYSSFKDGKPTGGGRIEYVRIFTLVAIFVLLIACINFMNLATAQSIKRSKEVGIRKVVGAFRKQLISQFLGEAMMFTLAAAVLGILLVYIILPVFNNFTEKHITIGLLNINVIAFGVALVLLTGFIAGSYPAFYLSGFRPATVLKGMVRSGRGAHAFRRVLVVTQFALSIAMIICTIVVFKQMQYIESRDMGFDRRGLLYMNMRGDMSKIGSTIKTEIEKNPFVESASLSTASPLKVNNFSWGVEWEGKQPGQQIKFMTLAVDGDYIKTSGLQLISGRTFNNPMGGDTLNVIINQKAAEMMGFDDAIGKTIFWWGQNNGRIIGVVKDFQFESMHADIQPVLMFPVRWNAFPNTLIVRAKNNDFAQVIPALQKLQTSLAPAYPFEYSIVDDDWQAMHKGENQMSGLFSYFAFLSITISCLGLFGLAAFSAEQRRKEIGVRKALGANVQQLTTLLTNDFMKLTLFGALPGCLLAGYYMTSWLSGFAFSIEIGMITYIAAIAFAAAIALATVSYQAIRAALENPISALRIE